MVEHITREGPSTGSSRAMNNTGMRTDILVVRLEGRRGSPRPPTSQGTLGPQAVFRGTVRGLLVPLVGLVVPLPSGGACLRRAEAAGLRREPVEARAVRPEAVRGRMALARRRDPAVAGVSAEGLVGLPGRADLRDLADRLVLVALRGRAGVAVLRPLHPTAWAT